MSKVLDFKKPITTLDGRRVTIYTTTAKGLYPVHGAIHSEEVDDATSWTLAGDRAAAASFLTDLINPPVKKTGWVVRNALTITGYASDTTSGIITSPRIYVSEAAAKYNWPEKNNNEYTYHEITWEE